MFSQGSIGARAASHPVRKSYTFSISTILFHILSCQYPCFSFKKIYRNTWPDIYTHFSPSLASCVEVRKAEVWTLSVMLFLDSYFCHFSCEHPSATPESLQTEMSDLMSAVIYIFKRCRVFGECFSAWPVQNNAQMGTLFWRHSWCRTLKQWGKKRKFKTCLLSNHCKHDQLLKWVWLVRLSLKVTTKIFQTQLVSQLVWLWGGFRRCINIGYGLSQSSTDGLLIYNKLLFLLFPTDSSLVVFWSALFSCIRAVIVVWFHFYTFLSIVGEQ